MKQILSVSFGVLLGVLLMQYFHRGSPTGNDENIRKRSFRQNSRTPLKKDRERSYPESGMLPREQVSGGVEIHKGLADMLHDPEADTNGTLVIDKIGEDIYLARGYAFANVIMLEGKDGIVIVDTTESEVSGRYVLNKLREITKKPIKAIILSHYHFDHVAGINAFIEDKQNPPDIYAYHTMPDIIKSNMVAGSKAFRGSIHQFGLQLGRERLWPPVPNAMDAVAPPVPNKLVYDEVHHVEIAGFKLTLLHVPADADDAMAVWLPDRRILLSADDFYKAFPNIYAIRGTPPRDALVWSRSLRVLRDLGADTLLPGHGGAIVGRQKIHDLLTVFISGMMFVHDQTVRLLNEFRHPDEIGKLVRLPRALQDSPYLRETYGLVEWTAKAVYQKYVGWFSGDPAELEPLTPTERSQTMIDWLGVDRILEEVESALEVGETQWALELVSHVYRVHPENIRTKWLRVQALRRRAAEQVNPSARNYYLTSALDVYGYINWKREQTHLLQDVGLVMGLMKYRLKAELTDGVNATLVLNFTDSHTTYRLQIVYSVLDLEKLSQADAARIPPGAIKITTTEHVWLKILMGLTQAAAAYTDGQINIDGSLEDARKFMSYF